MYNFSHLSLRSLYEQKAFWESEETCRLLKSRPEAVERVKAIIADYKREIRRRNKQPARDD